MTFNIEEAERLISDRRSVKPGFYTGGRISDQIVEKMLAAAVRAPTHGLTEPWRFHVFTGAGLQKLAEFLSTVYKENAGENFNNGKFEKIGENILKASHVVLIAMKRQETGKIPEWEEIASVACAVQNMHLIASAHGVGGYWSTGSMSTHNSVKDFMGLAGADKCLGMFYIAPYSGEIVSTPRRPVNEKTVWHR